MAVLGAGAGGLSAAVELTAAGHGVRLWNRSATTLKPYREAGGVHASGVLGETFTPLPVITTELAEAVDGAEVAVVCLPALAHRALADDLAGLGCRVPLLLNPGHTLGAAHVASRFARLGIERPPIAELSTLTYVARCGDGPEVRITGTARRVRAATLGTDDTALTFATQLWPSCRPEPDVFATGLANVNAVLHPPAAVLAAAWVEATGGQFAYYAEATTPAVATVMTRLDEERLALATAFGHTLDPLVQEMLAIGTVDAVPDSGTAEDQLRIAVSTGRANASIMAPASLEHRYYREDFAFAVVPMLELAAIAHIEMPVATALLHLVDCATHGAAKRDGLRLRDVGLEAGSTDELLDLVTKGAL
ncbi:NAD/NADP octopine/nopaline dehydrogenase family protein [Mycobacterium sp. NAZ190054]|uniref:NAD/NADP octopine/nopaline dehydrogenase family protein n=1 Tax=Mycobacterium sp. NAZ190054 TaxID=1747766 RepID=UPI0009EB323D|nr:NAD/NADP octopine/nopaline dehydrogenase family protein [Mycobacterium sp. NAZ190054]